MRVLATLTASLAVTMVWTASAEAVNVTIDGFVFGCDTPEGTEVEPALGEVGGVFVVDLPARRTACLETIDRKIDSCRANTGFESDTDNEKYAACLPVFAWQAKACVAHFELQRSKCGARDSGPDEAASETSYTVDPLDRVMEVARPANVRAGPGTDHAILFTLDAGAGLHVTGAVRGRDWLRVDIRDDGAAAFVYAPLLKESSAAAPIVPFGPEWSIAENQPCRVWNFGDRKNGPFTWSGVCTNGMASGQGRFTIRGGRYVYEGIMQAGRAQGYGTFTWLDGERYEGEWQDGKPHGHGTYTLYDGEVYEGQWRHGCFGERDGKWASIATSSAACGFE